MKRLRSAWNGRALIIAGLVLTGAWAALKPWSASAATAESSGPSFGCGKPSEIEAVICGDPGLSAADRRMAALYEVAKTGALGNGSGQLAVQRKWIRSRDASCAKDAWKPAHKSLRACIAAYYDERLEALAVATLMASPKESLAELDRINPAAAPLYRAAYDYAAIDDARRRAAAVETDLAPVYAEMDADLREKLSAATAHQAAASDENFADVFAIYGALGFESAARVTWPCAVLVKRPGLIGGLGSRFGGAIDGAVPGSDCEAALPPTPEVRALSDAAFAAQPPCQGTIRFSTGRDYAMLEDAVRLHFTKVWETEDRRAASMDPTERAWRSAHRATVDRAATALEAYYARTFAVERNAAKRDAASATDALVEAAFAYCE